MWHPILMINGYVITVLGLMMFIPSIVMKYTTGEFDYTFIQGAIISIFLGGSMFIANYGKIKNISILQGFLITISCWYIAPLICAIPLYNNGDIKTITDAIFEATSGITTTGASIIKDIESQPKSILIWRAMLNSIGGIGIVIFAVALMPFLGIGGMNIFKKENSDTEEKFLPKIRDIAKDIILAYLVLNIICATLLKEFGMNWFDAIAHALSTVCTGGFSTKNNSIASFNSAEIELIITFFMILGALPLTYFVLLFKERKLSFVTSNPQINTLFKLFICYILGFSLFFSLTNDISFMKSFRIIGFNFVSAMTTTGFTSYNYITWGVWAPIIIAVLTLHGGCTGSTSGSIKIFRWQVVFAFLKKHTINALSPNQATVIKTRDKAVSNDIVASVFVLVMSFLLAICFFVVLLCLCGLDFVTSFGAVLGAITSFGPGLTEATGPAGSYANFSDFMKYVLAFVMVLGRLEVVTVITLLSKIRFR
jgi:trk system potassium uptake protein TrkH